ncbi:hypothetical protein BGO17_00250 [Candidatus Saccharibacteria bacterium 49-20]|jgi:hypothetical protein|nr:MAG: hypothetical protein BGO17_00250 [Candidatus Saccharibacteria bacterium 49-20]
MIPIIVLAGVALGLFFGAFISKRRFGLLGLALTAGATLSTIWSYNAGLVVAATGVVPDGVITQAVAQSLVVLLPAILLLFHGYSYKGIVGRLVGAVLFTVLALAFLVEPLSYALPLDGSGGVVYSTIRQYKDIIISAGVILAVIDLFFTKPAHLAEKSKKKH